MLLAAIFLLALFTIALAVAIPRMAKSIQRDREVETMERGKQYMRAVRLYYRKFGRYPPNVDALVKSNEIRFLRKKYKDPTTGKEEWKPIQFGQNKAPTAMGFFGQPLAGAMSGGGCNGIAGASTAGGGGSLVPVSGGATDITASSNMGNCGGTDPSATVSSTTDPTAGAQTTPPSGGASTTGTNPTSGPTGGQTFGGAGIIGFSPNSPKPSILTYKKKKHYNEWEFVYDPITEQTMIPGAAPITGGQTPSPGTQQPPQQSPTQQPPPQQ